MTAALCGRLRLLLLSVLPLQLAPLLLLAEQALDAPPRRWRRRRRRAAVLPPVAAQRSGQRLVQVPETRGKRKSGLTRPGGLAAPRVAAPRNPPTPKRRAALQRSSPRTRPEAGDVLFPGAHRALRTGASSWSVPHRKKVGPRSCGASCSRRAAQARTSSGGSNLHAGTGLGGVGTSRGGGASDMHVG